MRNLLRVSHRYLGLILGAFWLVQAATGVALIFHRPLDDVFLGASGRPLNLKVLDRAIEELESQMPGARVIQFFVSGGVQGQIDLLIDDQDAPLAVVRVDGATGAKLRHAAWTSPIGDLSFPRLLLLVHKQLLSGSTGHWLVGFSGAILFINMLFAIRLAWPRSSQWRTTLMPRQIRQPVGNLFVWHRAVGLWLAALGLLISLTGFLLVSSPVLEKAIKISMPTPNNPPSEQPTDALISPGTAVASALRTFPDATFATASMPSDEQPWYLVELRQPGEVRRTYGKTAVFIDARDGSLLGFHDALTIKLGERLLNMLWPIHTGEWGGSLTRIISLLTGLWLIGLILLGLTLWWVKRNRATPSKRATN